jgi:choloylglycine hydrolase
MMFPFSLFSCTTFCFRSGDNGGDWIFGRNYDWDTGHCLLMVNKRGVVKTALTENNPAKWVSIYGSITFNQYGREFPLGGMNDAGLVIECMWLRPTRYPKQDAREELSELQWIQYQLDTCATVAEVVATDKKIRIEAGESAPLHFLVCDRTGDAAAIEFLDGKMTVYTGKNLPFSALANSTYSQSRTFVRTVKGDENSRGFQRAGYSLKRFMWAAAALNKWRTGAPVKPVDYAFKVLDRVSVSRTMFGVVYDVSRRRIYFRTKGNPSIRLVDMNAFDFACGSPVKVLDLAVRGSGNMTARFSRYTYEANYQLIKKAWQETRFLRGRPERGVRIRARYPGTLECRNNSAR